jgi:hypothetical protein
VPPPTDFLGQFIPLPGEEEEGTPPGSFSDFAMDWYAPDTRYLDRIVTSEGPPTWPRIEGLDDVLEAEAITAGGTVTDVELTDSRISFETTAIGVPHLVKVSYFPNWQATGAEGPYRATPSLMVVVPTEEQVVIEFRNTWVEWAGLGLTAVGLLAFAGALVARREKQDA